MAWDGNKFTVSKFEEQLDKYYQAHKNKLGYEGDFTQFKNGKYGALYYGAVQADLIAEIENVSIYAHLLEFARSANELIESNGLNADGIRREFMSELGFNVALRPDYSSFSLAVDYEITDINNQKIAKLLGSKCFAFGFRMRGDIVREYKKDDKTQAVTMRWTNKKVRDVYYKIVVVTVSDSTAAEQTTEEVKALFLKNHEERVVWGDVIQPQRILNEYDLPFSASVVVSASLTGVLNEYQSTPLRLPFDEQARPVITANDVTVERINPTVVINPPVPPLANGGEDAAV